MHSANPRSIVSDSPTWCSRVGLRAEHPEVASIDVNPLVVCDGVRSPSMR
jgi:hypothetical protein